MRRRGRCCRRRRLVYFFLFSFFFNDVGGDERTERDGLGSVVKGLNWFDLSIYLSIYHSLRDGFVSFCCASLL